MIVARLIGGLGNQMFQYAAGRALALRRQTTLFIDRRSFEEYKVHDFGLHHFALQVDDAPANCLPRPAGASYFSRLMRRWGIACNLKTYAERSFNFDPHVLDLPEQTYLDGYWQSERYFGDAIETIRADFQIKKSPSKDNLQCLTVIRSTLAVSVHVRRGDYVSNSNANQVHGTCPLAYYQQAIKTMHQRLGVQPEFFVFSDDPIWAKENLDLSQYAHHFVTHNDATANYEDLRLMASCQHHIIANSTFSWWGAWLNSSTDKVVIAPRTWFRANHLDDKDLIPSTWIRL